MEDTCRAFYLDSETRPAKISLAFSQQLPEPKYYENGERKVLVLGSPVLNDHVNYEEIGKRLLEGKLEAFIRDINGSFLFVIYDKASRRLKIANDRFASISFYYRKSKDIFMGSTSYSYIWKEARSQDHFKIDREAFYEFISLGRLFGDKTYDRDSKFLNSASILTYTPAGQNLSLKRYWRPKGAVETRELKEGAVKRGAGFALHNGGFHKTVVMLYSQRI
jgi:hypothetical protein